MKTKTSMTNTEYKEERSMRGVAVSIFVFVSGNLAELGSSPISNGILSSIRKLL